MCFGLEVDDERDEKLEIRKSLAIFDLTNPGGSWILPSRDCHFELVQQDVTVFECADGSQGAAFVLKATVQSKSGKLTGAEIRLSVEDSDVILDVTMPPDGAEFVTPEEVDGAIELKVGKPGLFVGYQTFGTTSCGMLGSKEAVVSLSLNPDQGTRVTSCLSAIVLVCLPDADRLRFDMHVSVQASLSTAGFLKGGRRRNHRIGNDKVKLALI